MTADAFDAEKYKCLEIIGEAEVSGKAAKIKVAIFQYEANPPKIKIQRAGKKKDGTEYTGDVGGMTATEAAAVWPLLKLAGEKLKKL
mgnify:CR=1 FL=1